MNVVAFLLFFIAPTVLNSEWPVHPRDPINAANFARIEKGMTLKQVEKILGGPGDEVSIFKGWHGRGRNAIIVGFIKSDGEQRATDVKRYFNPTPWQRIKEWWGDYKDHPDGSRSKRLKGAA